MTTLRAFPSPCLNLMSKGLRNVAMQSSSFPIVRIARPPNSVDYVVMFPEPLVGFGALGEQAA